MKKMKYGLLFLAVVLLLLCGRGFSLELPCYGGEDCNGNTADKVIKTYYENYENEDFSLISAQGLKTPFDENISLVSLEECFADETFTPYKSDRWYKDSYAYCVVNTKAYFLCREDCEYGDKGETVLNTFSYHMIMETESSQWKIVDFGY